TEKLGADRHRHLGGGGGRRGTAIGDKVDEGCVGLVSHRGDQRDATFGGGTYDDFLVEGPEVFEAAATACDDEEVRARHRCIGSHAVEAANGARDLLGCAFTLHRNRP